MTRMESIRTSAKALLETETDSVSETLAARELKIKLMTTQLEPKNEKENALAIASAFVYLT